MEIHHIPYNITVFGKQVKLFPNHVGEAFHEVLNTLPDGQNRVYYGLSWCIRNEIIYIAAAEQKNEDEAKQFNCETYTIEKGDYLCIPVQDWQNKTSCIKDYFEEIMKDERVDSHSPAIEVYKNDREMLCLVAVKQSIENLEEFAEVVRTFLNAANEFDKEEINAVPYKDGWTAAQVIVHVTKSNNGIAKAMKLPGEKNSRNADARVQELRNTFLNYSVKFKSPEFILPPTEPQEKDKVIAAFESSIEQLKEASKTANLSEAIKHVAFGEITKLELLHFVLFHIQRHTRQLRNILAEIHAAQFSSN